MVFYKPVSKDRAKEMAKEIQFFSTHNHTEISNFRLRDCIIKIPDLINRSIELGYSGVCCTDHEALSAHVRFIKRYKEIKENKEKYDKLKIDKTDEEIEKELEKDDNKSIKKNLKYYKNFENFKIGLGNEIYLVDRPEEDGKISKFFHFILIAKDKKGYEQIRRISSDSAWKNWYRSGIMERVPTYKDELESIIGNEKGHIIAQSACFRQGALVTTINGQKAIESITDEDYVLNKYGQFEKVNFPTHRLYKGNGYEIKLTGVGDNIVCTESHKFLTITNNKVQYYSNNLSIDDLDWVEAKDLDVNYGSSKHQLLLPVSKQYSQNKKNIKKEEWDNIALKKTKMSHRVTILPENVVITPEMMRFFGLFLGDGWINKLSAKVHRVGITFNEKEFDYYYSFVKTLEKSLNIKWSINYRKDQHKYDISSQSSDFYNFMYYIFGECNAYNKKIPNRIKNISPEYDRELLFGYLLADGYFRLRKAKKINVNHSKELKDFPEIGEWVSASVSKQLAQDMFELATSLLIPCNITIAPERVDSKGTHHCESYYLRGSGKIMRGIEKMHFYSHEDVNTLLLTAIDKKRFINIDNIWYKKMYIHSIKKINMNETVYCLNNESHSFVCNNVIVHNCLGSELDNLILEYLNTNDKSVKQKIDAFIKWCIKIFGKENFYLEIQPCVIKQDKDGNNLPHEQAMVNQFMFVLSDAYGLKVVCSTDSHYLTKNDAKIHEAYLKADDNEKSRNREVASFYETTYLFSVDELIETLSYHLTEEQIKAALTNTQDIFNKIEIFDLYHSTIVPTDKKIPPFKVRHIFKDWYDKYEYLKKYAESDDKQDQYLLYLVEQGFEKKKQWGESSYHFATYDENGNIIEEHDKIVTQEGKIARINEEFSSFWQISERLNQKLSAYYVLVRGLVHEVMWKVSFVGVARGSAGGSYICYLSEITQINPLKYDLPFWRHSSPLRPELPDIDLDSEALKRPLIFQNMHDYYGDENVLNTLTLKTEGTKSTILVCAKGFGINNDDAQHLADLVPFERGSNWSLKDCFYGNEENGRTPVKEFINEVNKYEGLKDTLFKIEGLICGRSIHASASYIFDAGYIVQNSKMRAPNGTTITAYNMEDSDYMGGLKVD